MNNSIGKLEGETCMGTGQNREPLDLLSLAEKMSRVARSAGAAIMEVYGDKFEVIVKEDESPLTEADLRSNSIIAAGLSEICQDIPLLSEESAKAPYSERVSWSRLWLVDPLDGTKEFVKRTDEFTVNIAMIENGVPLVSVVYAPALDQLYFAAKGQGAFKSDCGASALPIGCGSEIVMFNRRARNFKGLVVVGSRSHPSDALAEYLAELEQIYGKVEFVKAGSALKFCLVAEGKADIYPRLAPTWEWDTAAAHLVATESGCEVMVHREPRTLSYNKENLLNPWFVCRANYLSSDPDDGYKPD